MSITPLSSTNSYQQNVNQFNNIARQLNNEQVTKTFKQPGGNAIVTGKLPNGNYGTLIYDSTNTPRILIGSSPDDGRMGIWVSKSGQSVISLLGG